MQSSNPFEAPSTPLHAPRASDVELGVWRHGKQLVFSQGAELPRACIKCNAPTSRTLRRKLYWHHPAFYLLVAFNIIIYAVVALLVRKTAEVEVPLCETHQDLRRRRIMVATGLIALGLAALIASITTTQGVVLIGAVVTLIGGVIAAVLAANLMPAVKIDKTHAFTRGVSEEYLAALPDWVSRA